MIRNLTVAAAMLSLGLCSACGAGAGSPAATSRPCPSPAPTGPGLFAGVVAFSADGHVVAASPSPDVLFTPEPGDANLALTPGSVVVVVGATSTPASSDSRVLAPLPNPTTAPGGQQGSAFSAAQDGCAILAVGGKPYSVSVRSPDS